MDIRIRIVNGIDHSATGCWLWKGCLFNEGYGAIGFKGKTKLAHRIAYEAFVGQIPEGLRVLHRCDVKRCCNPEHLYLGDAKQNAKDAIERGQAATGERHWRRRNPERQHGDDAPNRKLCSEDVKKILGLFAAGQTQSAIARQFDVSVQQIHHIVHRRQWRTVKE